MINVNRRQSGFLLLTILIILMSLPAVYYIIEKPDLPISVYSSDSSIFIKKIKSPVFGLNINDRIISVDGVALSSREDIEIIMDTKTIGKPVELEIKSGADFNRVSVDVIPFYTTTFVIIQAVTSLFFLILGVFVLLKCTGVKAAELFHLAMAGASIIMLMTWGKVNESFDFSYIPRIIFHAAYIFTPLFFVHFSLVFPEDNLNRYKKYLPLLYFIGLMILIPNIISFIKASITPDSENITTYIFNYNFSRYFMAAMTFGSIIIFLLRYIHTELYVEKQKLKWLITGFIVGPMSFIILWVLPQAFTDYAFIPEELVYFLMLSVPVTFAISIVKYHLLDIDFIINRSIVYSSVILLIIAAYFLIVVSVTTIVENVNRSIISSISAVFVAFLFNPLKNYVHNFVDKKFFRVQYNYRKAVKAVSSSFKQFNDVNSLSKQVITDVSNLIPVDKISLIDVTDLSNPTILAKDTFSDDDLQFLKDKIFSNFSLQYSIILPEKVETGVDLFESDVSLKERKINLILTPGHLKGRDKFILVLGNKKSGKRYSSEDIDLITSIFNTAAGYIERLRIQEDFIRKSLEAEKLQELNEQKSLFVSLVSHDLKTPLTSIRMYSELISMNSKDDKVNNYAKYIEGESERLTRLINNVLNFSRIEKGIKEYSKEPVDLTILIKKTAELMNYQISIMNFKMGLEIEDCEMFILADPDAIVEMFVNLINNAIKYSGNSNFFSICSRVEGNYFSFSISDFGIGISESNQKLLFTPFFRADQAKSLKIGGTGLGLAIIKHIAEAHNIRIIVESTLGRGTTFKLLFPKYSREKIYEEHLNS